MNLEAHVLVAVAADVLQLQHHLALVHAGLALGVLLGHLAAHHHADQLIHGGLGRNQGIHIFAVADDLDAVGQAEDFLQAMGDVDDGDAALLEQLHNLEHALDLVVRQRGGGLVHNQHLGVLLYGLRNFNHLLIAHRQVFHKLPGVDFDAQLLEGLGSLGLHRLFIDGDALADGPTQEHVFRRRQLLDVVELLVNDGNSVFGRQLGRHVVENLAVDLDFARGGHHRAGAAFDEGGFSGAVFSDQAQDFAPAQLERYVVQRHHAGVLLSDVL